MFVRTTCTGIRAEGAHSTPTSTLTAAPNSHHRHPDQHLQPHLARFRRTHPASLEARPPATKAMCGNRDAPQLSGANNSNFGVAPIFHRAFRAHRSNRSDPKAIGRTRATPRAVLGGTLTSRRVGAATRRSASTTKAKRDPAVGGGVTGLLRTASELFCFLTTLDVEPKKRSPPKVSSTNGAFGVPCSIAGEHFITTDPN